MNAKQAIGMALLAAPFIVIGGYALLTIGFIKTLAAFGITAAIVVCVKIGVDLVAA